MYSLKIKMRQIRIIVFVTYTLIILIFLGTLVSGAQPLLEQPTIKRSFRTGEILEYSVKVKGIPAGTQILQVKDGKVIAGREVYLIESRSSVNKLFNIIYPYSEQSESIILKDRFCPVYYKKNLRDGGYIGSTTINFDDTKQIARVEKDQKIREIKIPDGVQDELSMIYLLRTKNVRIGEEYEFPALIGTKTFNVEVTVLRSENIKTIFGNINTLVVKSSPREVTLWITNDESRIPVRLEVNTKLGKLVAELRNII